MSPQRRRANSTSLIEPEPTHSVTMTTNSYHDNKQSPWQQSLYYIIITPLDTSPITTTISHYNNDQLPWQQLVTMTTISLRIPSSSHQLTDTDTLHPHQWHYPVHLLLSAVLSHKHNHLAAIPSRLRLQKRYRRLLVHKLSDQQSQNTTGAKTAYKSINDTVTNNSCWRSRWHE